MKVASLSQILKNGFEDLADPGSHPRFRCSAYLRDGLYLPCVIFASLEERVSLALKRFDETRADSQKPWCKGQKRFGRGMGYPDIVKTFVASGSQVASYEIARIERSPFALAFERLMEIKGETSMGWTQFTGQMSDGNEFEFGTTWGREFFMMPEGYSATDVVKIIPAERGGRPKEGQVIYRERQSFTCYLDGL